MKYQICDHCGTVCAEVENPFEPPYFCPECKEGLFSFETTEIDDDEHIAGKTYYTTRHMCVDIQGFLNWHKRRKMTGVMTDNDGNKMTDKQCREYLAECQSKGWKVLRMSDSPCPGFDHFEHGCPGHLQRVVDAEKEEA